MRLLNKGERGQEMVEAALVLPVLLLLFLSLLETGKVIYSYNTLAHAAREGARYGSTHPDDTAGIRAKVLARAIALNAADLTITVTPLAGPAVRVQITYPHRLITGQLIRAIGGNPVINLTTSTTMHVE